jgi:hypothetical protein
VRERPKGLIITLSFHTLFDDYKEIDAIQKEPDNRRGVRRNR